jgi:hypothetical protein
MKPAFKKGYKQKTMRKHLRNKVKEWLDTLPKEIATLVSYDVMVCGGALTSMSQGDAPNDYDIYFKTNAAAELVARHYCHKDIAITSIEDGLNVLIPSTGVLRFPPKTKEMKYYPVIITSNAISLSDKVQLILRFTGEPEQVFSNFDFIHTHMAYDYGRNVFFKSIEALECIRTKTLIYRGSKYPLATIFRIRKFSKRGWDISVGQILKIAYQLQEFDLADPLVLREQLLGVDLVYTQELVYAITKKLTDNERVDYTYLAQLVDEIFDEEGEHEENSNESSV